MKFSKVGGNKGERGTETETERQRDTEREFNDNILHIVQSTWLLPPAVERESHFPGHMILL